MPTYTEINIDKVISNDYQPRNSFDDQSIQQLAQSIAENGLIQPIIVKETYTGYQLIAGERRLRACKLLGQQKIQAVVIKASEKESATLALIENVQREDLNVIDEATAYRTIMELTGLNQTQLAQKVGKSQSAVANKMRLLSLDEPVIAALKEKRINERQGRALLAVEKEKQSSVLKYIEQKILNVKDTEAYIEGLNAPKKKKNNVRCFGVSAKLIINSVRETFRKAKQLTNDVSLVESEDEENYIMTITIKK